MALQLVAPAARKQIRPESPRTAAAGRMYWRPPWPSEHACCRKMSNKSMLFFSKDAWAMKTYAFSFHGLTSHLFQIRRQLQKFTSRPAGGRFVGQHPWPIQQRPRRRVLDLSSSATALVRLWRGLCLVSKFFSPNFTIYLSHQIFCLIYRVLNIGKKTNFIILMYTTRQIFWV